MFQILYFLQYAIVESQICHGMDGCGIRIYYFFIHLSLSYLFHLFLQLFTASSPLSHTLSSSLFPFALFSSHSWIMSHHWFPFYHLTNFIITNLLNLLRRVFFFPTFGCSLLSVLSQSRLSAWVWLWVCDFQLWSVWV